MGDSREKTCIYMGQAAFDNLLPRIKAFLEMPHITPVVSSRNK
jgi:hypothetical protein